MGGDRIAAIGTSSTRSYGFLGNAIDDDCDGLPDAADTADCPCEVQECYSENCPPGYVCEPLGCCVLP